MIQNKFKPAVLKMPGYLSPPQSEVTAKLNQNESPFDLPEEIKKVVLEKMAKRHWQRYPVNQSPEIKKRLAKWYNLTPEHFLLGNGSNQLLQTLFSACITKGDRVVYCPPTFGLFEIFTAMYDGVACTVCNPPNGAVPQEEILQTIVKEEPKLVLLCSPNNPTGAEFDAELVRQVCRSTPGLVLLDEAYGEFSDRSFLPLLRECDNLIISRTFSKAFSMAGLRLGYFIADCAVIEQLAKINLPYNINIFSELVACEVLDRPGLLADQIEKIKNERQRLYLALSQLPKLIVYPSAANFLLFHYEDCRNLLALLREQGILIRNVSDYPLLNNHARVTIGSSEENNYFLEKLLEIIIR